MDRPAAAAFNPTRFRLGEVLVSRDLITSEQLKEALASQKATGRKLGRALTDLKLVSEAQIGQVVAEQMGLEFVDLAQRDLDPTIVKLLPEARARRFRAIVLARDAAGLTVGLVDPSDMVTFDALSRLLAMPVRPAVVAEELLLQTIDRIYQRGEEISGFARELAADIGDGVLSLASLETSSGAEEAPVVRLLHSIFQSAVAREVSDIHFEPQERQLQIRFRIDGVMRVQSAPDPRIAGAVVQRLKLMSSLDISEKRLPQDGRFRLTVSGQVLDVRISTLPSQYGESVVMRLLTQNTDRMKLGSIGMPAPILARLRAALAAPSGMVLVTGPTGSGKTTTLYSALAELNTPQTKIITAEDPVEYRLPGLTQVQINDKVDLSFARVLRSCLRQDPDVILVGEMRDQETAEIGLRAALTGHLVLSTLHTNDAASTPLRLRDMGLKPYMVALGLRLVLAQRLVRLVCANCRVPEEPAPHQREWLGDELRDTQGRYTAYRGTGCNQCHDSGYRGRTAVYEMLEMTPELVHLANQEDPSTFVEHARRDFAAFTLRRHALALVAEGRTSVAEAMRVGADT